MLVRAVNAMMRALGGATVQLRVPTNATSGIDRELGLSPALLDEIELAPVVVRNLATKDGRAQIEVLMSANGLDAVLAARGGGCARNLLKTVESVRHHGRLFQVTELSADSFAGLEYMFRIKASE